MSRSNPMHHATPTKAPKTPLWPFPVQPLAYPLAPPIARPVREPRPSPASMPDALF